MDNEIKRQMTDYADMRTALTALNKKQEGGFMTRDLTECFEQNNITSEMFPSSAHLATLVAIIGK